MVEKIVKRKDFSEKLNLKDQVDLEDTARMNISSSGSHLIRKKDLDASHGGHQVIEEAKNEARIIREESQNLLQRVKDEVARAKQEGLEEGKREGIKEVSELLMQAKLVKEKMFKDVEKEALKLIYDIAEKIIGRDLYEREESLVDLIRQALYAAIGQQIVILVNPKDLSIVKKNHAILMQALDSSHSLQIRADEKVSPKGCLIETEVGTIDAQLETQLEIIRKVLGLEGEKEGPADH